MLYHPSVSICKGFSRAHAFFRAHRAELLHHYARKRGFAAAFAGAIALIFANVSLAAGTHNAFPEMLNAHSQAKLGSVLDIQPFYAFTDLHATTLAPTSLMTHQQAERLLQQKVIRLQFLEVNTTTLWPSALDLLRTTKAQGHFALSLTWLAQLAQAAPQEKQKLWRLMDQSLSAGHSLGIYIDTLDRSAIMSAKQLLLHSHRSSEQWQKTVDAIFTKVSLQSFDFNHETHKRLLENYGAFSFISQDNHDQTTQIAAAEQAAQSLQLQHYNKAIAWLLSDSALFNKNSRKPLFANDKSLFQNHSYSIERPLLTKYYEQTALDAFNQAFQAQQNDQPFVISLHFALYNAGAYWRAARSFMLEHCQNQEQQDATACISNDWHLAALAKTFTSQAVKPSTAALKYGPKVKPQYIARAPEHKIENEELLEEYNKVLEDYVSNANRPKKTAANAPKQGAAKKTASTKQVKPATVQLPQESAPRFTSMPPVKLLSPFSTVESKPNVGSNIIVVQSFAHLRTMRLDDKLLYYIADKQVYFSSATGRIEYFPFSVK